MAIRSSRSVFSVTEATVATIRLSNLFDEIRSWVECQRKIDVSCLVTLRQCFSYLRIRDLKGTIVFCFVLATV